MLQRVHRLMGHTNLQRSTRIGWHRTSLNRRNGPSGAFRVNNSVHNTVF